MVLFIMLYKVVLTFDSVNEILKCDHSRSSAFLYFHDETWESFCFVLFCFVFSKSY